MIKLIVISAVVGFVYSLCSWVFSPNESEEDVWDY